MFKHLITAKYRILSSTDFEAKARRFLAKYFPDANLPMPVFKVVRHTNPKWNGRCVYRFGETSTIELQKRILGDDKTLDRILAHELIHHADFLLNLKGANARAARNREGHGKFFREAAERVNAAMGKDYVTEKSDATYVAEDKLVDFYVLIEKHPDKSGRYMFAKALRPSSKQQQYIERHAADKGAKLIKSKDRKFLEGVADIGKGWSVPKDEFQDLLKTMYEGELGGTEKRL